MRYLASANLIHTACTLLGCLLGAWYRLRAAGGLPGVAAKVPDPGFTNFLNVAPGLFAAWFVANLGAVGSSQSVVQILGSAESVRNARRGAVLAAGVMVAGGALATLSGLAARALFPGIAPAGAFAAGLLPVPFVLLKPELFPLIFMARGLRVSLFAVLIAGFYLPLLASGRAGWAIGLGAAATVGWFLAGSPF